MATVEAHYQNVLSEVYVWMLGGYESQLPKNRNFFETHAIQPRGSTVAVDLGAGCGFQSIPLAEKGFSITAIDLDEHLLSQLKANDATAKVAIVQDDMLNFASHISAASELIVCMTDTLLHLESQDRVRELFSNVFNHLESSGQFVITFRDLSIALENLDRFIPVKQDDSRIFTCFLEYETDVVKVHDLVYHKINGHWSLKKSFYCKLRLSPNWVKDNLFKTGFVNVTLNIENGIATAIAKKADV